MNGLSPEPKWDLSLSLSLRPLSFFAAREREGEKERQVEMRCLVRNYSFLGCLPACQAEGGGGSGHRAKQPPPGHPASLWLLPHCFSSWLGWIEEGGEESSSL